MSTSVPLYFLTDHLSLPRRRIRYWAKADLPMPGSPLNITLIGALRLALASSTTLANKPVIGRAGPIKSSGQEGEYRLGNTIMLINGYVVFCDAAWNSSQ